MTRKIVMVGNRSFRLDANIGMQIVDIMTSFGDDVVFLTRGSDGFDRFVMAAGPLIGKAVLRFPGHGGTDNLLRDQEIVKIADSVLAFFDYETMHDEKTGTAMLVEKALNAKKPTRVYTAIDGQLVWAGETDEEPA